MLLKYIIFKPKYDEIKITDNKIKSRIYKCLLLVVIIHTPFEELFNYNCIERILVQ